MPQYHPPGEGQGEVTSIGAARQQLEALTLAGPKPLPQGWELQETIGNLALQQSRNGSDASFKVTFKFISLPAN
jgi:hypothetical protein